MWAILISRSDGAEIPPSWQPGRYVARQEFIRAINLAVVAGWTQSELVEQHDRTYAHLYRETESGLTHATICLKDLVSWPQDMPCGNLAGQIAQQGRGQT